MTYWVYLSFPSPSVVPVVEEFEDYDTDGLPYMAAQRLSELLKQDITVTVTRARE